MRFLFYSIGITSLSLGVIGAFLPILPTVPFLLVSAWAFARSSPQLQQRILNHPGYGHHVRNWQEQGAISRLAKFWAIGAMSLGVAVTIWLGLPLWIIAMQAGICTMVAAYVATRPEC